MSTAKKVAKPKAAETAETAVAIAYKGFDKNLCCTPNGKSFQYEIGKTYTHNGSIGACDAGFHACEFPLAVLSYYGLHNGNRFAVVEQSGQMDRKDDKTASGKITIKAEIGIPGLIKASVEWMMAKAVMPTSGNYANSATSGNSAHSATSGDSAHSATSGYSAHSATSGDSAHSATSGNYANSATSGNYANSATSGYSAHSATSGDYANSATSGYSAKSSAKGVNAVAANAGDGAAMAAKGGAIFIVERDATRKILAVFASLVGDNGIKADTWYALRGGKPVEVSL